MTEEELIKRLTRGAFRERLNGALWWGCSAVGLGLVAAISVTVIAKLLPAWRPVVLNLWNGLGAPLALIALALAIGLWRTRPNLKQIAYILDRKVRLQEHLSTWLEYHSAQPSTNPTQTAFIEAQKRATLRQAEHLNPTHHLPVRLPPWSAALWLALLFLGCAILMPEREKGAHAEALARQNGKSGQGNHPTGAPQVRLSNGKINTPIITPFSPTELYKARLVVMDENADKAEMLRELESRIGGLTDRELSPEVLDLISELRKQVSEKNNSGKRLLAEGSKATGSDAEPETDGAPRHVGAAKTIFARAALLGLAQDRFPDVAEALARYYGRPRKSATPDAEQHVKIVD